MTFDPFVVIRRLPHVATIALLTSDVEEVRPGKRLVYAKSLYINESCAQTVGLAPLKAALGHYLSMDRLIFDFNLYE